MEEKMLITQALDERDFLIKKITDKITAFKAVDYAKHNETKTWGEKKDRKEYEEETKAAFQQICDLIQRYDRIEAAIVASNAVTKIKTSYGEYTVAAAIALKNRLKIDTQAKNSFEDHLIKKMKREYSNCMLEINDKNSVLDVTAENMRFSILGKDSKIKDDKPLEVVESYVKENKAELVDPLGIVAKLEELNEKRFKLFKELETQIKVSNATTTITI